MKIIFFGTPSFVIPVLETLHKNFDVVAVVTAQDQKSGRKQLLTPSPIKQYCLTSLSQSQVVTPQQFDDKTMEQLQTLKADLYITAAYGKIIPETLLQLPQYGALNIHPSLLPKYRGPTPIQAALLNGDETTGISFMQMDAKMDHGPLIKQTPYKIKPTDTFLSLAEALFAQSAEELPQVIEDYIAGNLEPKVQDETKATYVKRITKQDGYIDSQNPPTPIKLNRMIRAYYPWPTAWTKIRIKGQEVRIKLLPASVIETRQLAEKQSHTPFVLQLEGKKPIALKDFLNGYPEAHTVMQKLFVL